ncbi:MAG: Uma2 family endonuclease [Streptosporangiaceae bacterium]|nr:Uma2 family endonuclease [Streptosporangiaceae bacterium]MBV9858158.1 Uma2 family endonuclease [Streptosporangiaceae bacterium]
MTPRPGSRHSPATRTTLRNPDLNRKKSAYATFGVPSYWIVDPDPRNPSLTAFELRSRDYSLEAEVAGDEVFRARRPFSADIVPAQLVKGLR